MDDQTQPDHVDQEQRDPLLPSTSAKRFAALFVREQQGQVLVILALFIVVLCLFVALITDVARAQLNAVYTQRGSDAGALGGVVLHAWVVRRWSLPGTNIAMMPLRAPSDRLPRMASRM